MGNAKSPDLTGGWPEIPVGVLGVDAEFHRPASPGDFRIVFEALSLGDVDLGRDQVDSGDHLGHRVFYLQAGIHLEEEKIPGPVLVEELDRPRPAVIDRGCPRDRRLAQTLANLIIDRRGWTLLQHLLVVSLQGALPLAEKPDGTVAIPEDLDLDVASGVDEPLEVDSIVTKSCACFRSGSLPRLGEAPG